MRYGLLFLALLLLSSCASKSITDARKHYHNGRVDEALMVLDDCDKVFDKDKLLCLMEKGSILFYSGEYEQSTTSLLLAAQLMKEQDQISVLDQSSAIVVNDKTTEYKGEFAERLWVHTLLMMNFLLQEKLESGVVEAKQALEVFEKHSEALSKAYFTKALIALCFENLGKYDDARIEYETIQEVLGDNFIIPPQPADDKIEVVFFITQGKIPRKVARDVVVPPSVRISLPEYTGYSSVIPYTITNNDADTILNISSNLGQIARISLKNRVSEYVTRQAIRVGTKEAIAQAVGQESGLAEAVARLILFIAEQADTRSWQTLPGGLTMIRLRLNAGRHVINIAGSSKRPLTTVDIFDKGGSRLYFLVHM